MLRQRGGTLADPPRAPACRRVAVRAASRVWKPGSRPTHPVARPHLYAARPGSRTITPSFSVLRNLRRRPICGSEGGDHTVSARAPDTPQVPLTGARARSRHRCPNPVASLGFAPCVRAYRTNRAGLVRKDRRRASLLDAGFCRHRQDRGVVSGDRMQRPFWSGRQSDRGRPGQAMCTSTRRFRGPSNSQKKIPCQVPSAGRPPTMGTVTECPTSEALMWAAAFPSVWR